MTDAAPITGLPRPLLAGILMTCVGGLAIGIVLTSSLGGLGNPEAHSALLYLSGLLVIAGVVTIAATVVIGWIKVAIELIQEIRRKQDRQDAFVAQLMASQTVDLREMGIQLETVAHSLNASAVADLKKEAEDMREDLREIKKLIPLAVQQAHIDGFVDGASEPPGTVRQIGARRPHPPTP